MQQPTNTATIKVVDQTITSLPDNKLQTTVVKHRTSLLDTQQTTATEVVDKHNLTTLELTMASLPDNNSQMVDQ
jgi:hypothetical protein